LLGKNVVIPHTTPTVAARGAKKLDRDKGQNGDVNGEKL
jgi:hypothetical protein